MPHLIIASLILAASASAVVARYFVLGFTHVLPEGLDHILFILGLFFLSRSLPVLLFQLTLFTLAHSLTLGLSLYGFVELPTVLVEVAIALSISFIAVENLFARDKLRVWRPWVVFGCGLIHGLGFAHSFAATRIPQEDFLPAVFSFNLGIEFAQLTVVGLAFASVAAWWKRDCYVAMIARPSCFLIALSGLYLAARHVI